jgi:hypothetical protein
MNNIKNEKGSIMVLLILVIAVTSLLGTSILSITFLNYKMRRTNSDIVENSYMSESGIDEGYALCRKLYDDVYIESENYISNLVEDINLDISKITCGEINLSESSYNNYISMDNKIKKDAVDLKFRYFFEDKYSNELKDMFAVFSSKISTDINLNATVYEFSLHRELIVLKSSYEENSIKKYNSVDITVNSPIVHTAYTDDVLSSEAMAYNPLLSKPAFVQGNVYFEGIAQINGDMVVLGNIIDTEENSNIKLSFNELAVYGNKVEDSKLSGSIRLDEDSSISNVDTLYTNSIYSDDSLHNISGIPIAGIEAVDIIMDSESQKVIDKALGLGVSNLAEGFIDDMKALLKNIGGNPSNSIQSDTIDYDKTQPVQLLYDIVSGGNIGAKKFAFTSTSDDNYYICSTNENSKSIYIFGPPYYFDNNQNNNMDKDIYGNCLNINAMGIDSNQEIIYDGDSSEFYSLHGIIVSAGDVHLIGNIDFEGSIICFGNLFIEGAGIKKIKNDKSTNLAWQLKNSGDSFYNAFAGFDRFLKLDIDVENLSTIDDSGLTKPLVKRNWRVSYYE